jgi:hypothetical protein
MFSKFENHFQSRSRSGRPDSERDHIQYFDTKADLELLEGVENLNFHNRNAIDFSFISIKSNY